VKPITAHARFVVQFIGQVQGVGFRMTCLREAKGLDIHGHVSNQPDGSVLMDIDAIPSEGRDLIGRIQNARQHYIADTVATKSDSLGRSTGFGIR
jgi:acylphosphatase